MSARRQSRSLMVDDERWNRGIRRTAQILLLLVAAICVVAAFVQPPAVLALTIPVGLLYHLERGSPDHDRILLRIIDLVGRFIAVRRE